MPLIIWLNQDISKCHYFHKSCFVFVVTHSMSVAEISSKCVCLEAMRSVSWFVWIGQQFCTVHVLQDPPCTSKQPPTCACTHKHKNVWKSWEVCIHTPAGWLYGTMVNLAPDMINSRLRFREMMCMLLLRGNKHTHLFLSLCWRLLFHVQYIRCTFLMVGQITQKTHTKRTNPDMIWLTLPRAALTSTQKHMRTHTLSLSPTAN